MASRNIKGANYTNVNSLHAYDILNANQVFLCEKALEALNN
jgi:ribosomal protein L4